MKTVHAPGRSVPFIIAMEACERFSFYGMVALLTLYLIRPEDGGWPPGPGQGFSEGDAASQSPAPA